MYQPSEDLALFEREKYSLVPLFCGQEKFMTSLQLNRGHLISAAVNEKHFLDVRLENIQFMDVEFLSCHFRDLQVSNSEFQQLRFKNCTFYRATMPENAFRQVEFIDCYFEDCQIDWANPGIVTSNVVRKMSKVNESSSAPGVTKSPEANVALGPRTEESTPSAGAASRFGALEKAGA